MEASLQLLVEPLCLAVVLGMKAGGKAERFPRSLQSSAHNLAVNWGPASLQSPWVNGGIKWNFGMEFWRESQQL